MSDPFDILRKTPPQGLPDVAAIKGRARRIERRRRVAISSSAIVIAAIAIGGVLLRPNGAAPSSTVAQSRVNETPTAGAATEFKAAAPAVPSPTRAVTAGAAGGSASSNAAAQVTRQSDGAAAAAPASGSQSNTALQLSITAAAAGPHMERFTLKACNPGSSSVAVTFPTGQRYDFEVKRNGSLVWRWSNGMAFTQMYGQESWAPKQCKSYTATWNGTNSSNTPQPTGSYQVTGILASSPRQSTAPKTFCLDLC